MISFNKIKPLPIGLHIGPHHATMAQMIGSPGKYELYAMAQGDLPDDDGMSPEEHDQEVAEQLRQLVSDHQFSGRQVVSSFGAEELFVQNVRLPQLPPEEIAKVVNWEAEERLPYPLSDAELRYMMAGQVRQDADVKQEVILLSCHKGVVQRRIELLEESGLTPVGIDVEPCAVLRSLRSHEEARENRGRRAYLNLGDKSTTVIFAEGDQILFLKYVSSGGHHLDLAVARHLNLELHEAARMRGVVNSAESLDPEDEVHRSVIDAIRQPLESMGAEIELCLRYYKVTFRGKPLDKIFVTGDGASPWLMEFLTDRLGTKCEIGNPFDALSRWPTTQSALDRPWRWSTAMGLSMKKAG